MNSRLNLTALLAMLAIIAGSLCIGVGAEPIGSLSLDRVGEEVSIEGAVTRLLPSSYDRQPNRLTVSDSSGAVTVVIWPDVFGEISPAPARGSAVRISGEVSEYRGELQLQVGEAEDIAVVGTAAAATVEQPTSAPAAPVMSAPAPAPSAGATPLSQVTADRDGAAVVVEGTITEFRAAWNERAPNIITITDATGSAPVVIWPDDFDQLNPAPETGNQIRVSGAINVYRDNAQIRVDGAAGITILSETGANLSQAPSTAPATTSAPAAATSSSGAAVEIAVSDIDGSTVGQTILINGSIAGVRAAWNDRAPNILTLSDGTSTLPAVMWSQDWDQLAREPAVGDSVRVVGEVTLYERRNELQLRIDSLEFTD